MNSYLTLQGTTYHFRFFIPESYQPAIGQKVIKISLRTGRKRLATRKARELASATRKYLQTLPEGNMKPEQKREFQKRLRKFLATEIEKDELHRAMPIEVPNEREFIEETSEKLKKSINGPVDETVEKLFNNFLDQYNINIPKDSVEYLVARREYCKTLIELDKISLLRIDGDTVGERKYIESIFPSPKAETRPQKEASPQELHLVIDLAKKYSEELNTTDSTKQKYTFTLNEFVQIAGSHDISKMSHAILRDYVEVLKKLPPNYTKNHPDKHPLDIATMKHDKLITPRTINDKIGIVSRFFKWCIDQGYMDINYAERKRVPGGKPQHSTHEPYTLEDLQKIFNAPQYVEDKHRSPYQFWLIPLALFTGARQSELAQLRCDDLYETDGLWCIRIMPNDEDESSRVKTENAIRTIPLHPILTKELNFPGFVNRVRNEGHDRIFPEIKPRQGKYGKVVSQWFNDRFKNKLDLTPPRKGFKKDFHSFRNSFINAAKQARVDIRMVEETVGHASAMGSHQQSTSGDFYAGNYNEVIRYEELMLKVKFTVNLTNLTKSKYVTAE